MLLKSERAESTGIHFQLTKARSHHYVPASHVVSGDSNQPLKLDKRDVFCHTTRQAAIL